MILYLRVVPGFGIAAEMARRPEIRSRPVVLGGLPHQRGIVREASFLAQRSGVRAGMALSQAHQQCPDAVFLNPDLPHYEGVWQEICTILGSFTPSVEPIVMGQAVADLSGCERSISSSSALRYMDSPGDILGAARAIAVEIRRCGIAPWLGLASNRITAELASTVVDEEGITVIEHGRERAFLAGLPIALLPDIDPRMMLTFQVLGLRTIGQFADLPAPAVRQRFGVIGERLHAWARGIDPRPVLPPPSRPVVTARRACEEGTFKEAVELLRRLAEECAAELQRRRLAGRVVTLKLWWKPSDPVAVIPRDDASARALPPPTGHKTPKLPNEPISMKRSFPIPYRIHSMLPQPGNPSPPPSLPSREEEIAVNPIACRPDVHPAFDTVSAVVRTPIDTAPPLVERAGRLLMQQRPRPRGGRSSLERCPPLRPLQAIELEISEFERPAQLIFTEIDRIDETGRMRGMDAGRLQTLLRQEEILATRYGDPTFRHVTHVDPSSILTERRFRWNVGLLRDRIAAPRRKR